MRINRTPLFLVFLGILVAAAPSGLKAQDAEQDSVARAKVDSLEARIRKLEARLDSLLAALARGEDADSAAQGAAAELEALRAAAQKAAGDQEQDTTEASRTRNLSILNPEISVTGDVLGQFLSPAGEASYFTFVPREFEFAFEAALDPYTRTKVFLSYEQEFAIAGLEEEVEEGEEGHGHSGFGLEEGYLYWVGLPAQLGLKVGHFRQQIGLYNRWHNHALFEVDRPLPTVAFLGHDGLIQTGLNILAPPLRTGPGLQTLTLEVTNTSNGAMFDDSKTNLAVLGNFTSFWDLSPASYLELGAAAVYGENREESLKSTLFNVFALFRWRPPGQALYRDLRLAGEYYWARKNYGDPNLQGNGGYLQANYRLARRWVTGLRYDFLDDYGNDPNTQMVVPSITWWQSEWIFLRLQYHYVKPSGLDASHTVIAQVVWAVGPHKHETY
jgi:hypothetical protein